MSSEKLNPRYLNFPGDKSYQEKREVKRPGDDLRFEQLTARDHVCIMLKVPRSEKEWINSLIIESKL